MNQINGYSALTNLYDVYVDQINTPNINTGNINANTAIINTATIDNGTITDLNYTSSIGTNSTVNNLNFTTATGSNAYISNNVEVGKLLASTGTALVPSISFIGDQNSGIFNPSSDSIGFTTNGTQRMILSTVLSAPIIRTVSGLVSAPSYTFQTDTNTGLYNPSSDTIGFSTNGINRLTIENTNITSGVNFTTTDLRVNNVSVHIGDSSGITNQQTESVCIGRLSGNSNMGLRGIGLGAYSAQNNQGDYGIAIGFQSGNTLQGSNSIGIG